jgi:hypothetical protein
MCKVISKKRMSTFKTQTYLACILMVAWSWCKELKKITQELETKRKQFENHKSLNNFWTKMKKTTCLKNTKKNNSKKAMCLEIKTLIRKIKT